MLSWYNKKQQTGNNEKNRVKIIGTIKKWGARDALIHVT